MAVLFIMVTGSNAGALERLANETAKYTELETCALGASLLSMADDARVAPKEVYDTLIEPQNRELLKEMIDHAKSQASKVRDLRNYRIEIDTALNAMSTGDNSYTVYITECVIQYYDYEA